MNEKINLILIRKDFFIMRVSDFKKDLAEAKVAEKIALDVLSYTTENVCFEDVSDLQEYWHKGDIVARDHNKDCYYLDVKDDCRIADTGNILCEEAVHYRRDNSVKQGFMYSGYDYLCIVSQPEKKIYIINFKKLQKHYKEGRYTQMHYGWQWSDIYLFPLSLAFDYGMVEAEIYYNNDGREYYPVQVNKCA